MKNTLHKLLISVTAIVLIVVAQTNSVDDVGLEHTEQGLKRALITYSVSRGINGVISVVQGTEVAIEPVGVGMTFTPGQILDPINDLIERFSTVVLLSGTAFGIQRVFLEVLAAPVFSVIVALSVGLALVLLWRSNLATIRWRELAYRSALILLLVRFSVPMVAIFSENFYQIFLAPQFESSSLQLATTTKELQALQNQAQENTSTGTSGSVDENSFLGGGIFSAAKDLVQSASNTLDMKQHLNDISNAAENVSEHAIKLMVVFLFQTIILPLLSVWLLFHVLKWLALRLSFPNTGDT